MTFPSTERVLAVSDVLLVSMLKLRWGLKSSRTINVQVLLNISQILLIWTTFIRLASNRLTDLH